MLDIRAYVILLLDFPLCFVIVAKNEIKSLLRSGGTYCCYTWTDKLLLRYGGNVVAMRGLASYCCAAGGNVVVMRGMTS
jgi:hypothetical protein